MPKTWLIDQSDTHVLVTRRKPVRWDVEASVSFSPCHPLRLAHQVRQDLWRELQKIKGFCPAVEIELGDTFTIRAGGRILRHVPPGTNDRILALLNNGINRRRWLAYARYKT